VIRRSLRNDGPGDSANAQPLAGHHVRRLDGYLSRHEKPLLVYMAKRIPGQIMPDHLTGLGLLGAVTTLVGLLLSHLGAGWLALAVFGLILNWLGDSLDGTLARLRRIERPRYGFLVDHMTDVLAQSIVILGLGLSPYLRFDVACLILITYLAVSIFTFVKLHVRQSLCLSYGGIGPTELRVILAAGMILAAAIGSRSIDTVFGPVAIYDLLAGGFVVLATVSLIVLVRTEAHSLATIEPAANDLLYSSGRSSHSAPARDRQVVLASTHGKTLVPIVVDAAPRRGT
jgi:phosphatidylglycerophosphate synthase